MVAGADKTHAPQTRPDGRSAAQAGDPIRIVARNEEGKAAVMVAVTLRRTRPIPLLKQFGLHRIVMDRDKEIGSTGLLRTCLKTFNAGIEIDWPYKQATCRECRSQADGQHPVAIELLATTCADRARSR